MSRVLPLSTGLGEVLAPQTLVAGLIVGPEGVVTPDPGVLHGRSELEGQLQLVPRKELVGQGQVHWVVWIAVEMDASNQLVRYKGMSVSEWLVNRETRVYYKSLAEAANRMSEAMRGGVNVAPLTPHARSAVKQQLISMGPELWDRAPSSIQEALSA